MCNPAHAQENETHELIWDFDIQTDPLISARRPDLIIINKQKKKKRICKSVDVLVPVDHRIKLKEDEYIGFAMELKKKTMEHEDDNYTNRE